MGSRKRFIFFLMILVLAALACSKAGLVLTPEEATAIADMEAQATADAAIAATGDLAIQVGDRVRFIGSDYLVLMKRDPGTLLIAVQSEKGSIGVVLAIQVVDDVLWYQIEVKGGAGWLPEILIEKVEDTGEDILEVGETADLVGSGATVDILVAPGNSLGSVKQEVGVDVTIIQVTGFEGQVWYRIVTPAGEGWVPANNLVGNPDAE